MVPLSASERECLIFFYPESLFGMIGTDLQVANQEVILITVETASALEFFFSFARLLCSRILTLSTVNP